MSAKEDWVRGYARQSQADFTTYENLQSQSDIPACHSLLLLQMACEKLVKAHLIQQGGDPTAFQTSHAYTAKTLPIVIRQELTIRGMKPSQTIRHSHADEASCSGNRAACSGSQTRGAAPR